MFRRFWEWLTDARYSKPIAPAWIQTWSGLQYDFENPQPNQITIGDIAHALSHICRFTGHVNRFYSVAEHCVRASYLVPQEDAIYALLHDASEAYLTDVNKPLKQLLGESYRRLEERAERVILRRFGLTPWIPVSVKRADIVLMLTERRDLLDHQLTWKSYDSVEPLADRIQPWTSEQAHRTFLRRFYELMEEQ